MADQVEYRIGARADGALDAFADLRHADEIVLEDQPVALAVMLDEIEERHDGRAQPLTVVGGGAQRLSHAGHQIVGVLVQHRQV
ncbi:Uncharacterised protein [Mycobacteroides abscessus]|nr:Uncharacterised protein [Mycobacteroides abscessus]